MSGFLNFCCTALRIFYKRRPEKQTLAEKRNKETQLGEGGEEESERCVTLSDRLYLSSHTHKYTLGVEEAVVKQTFLFSQHWGLGLCVCVALLSRLNLLLHSTRSGRAYCLIREIFLRFARLQQQSVQFVSVGTDFCSTNRRWAQCILMEVATKRLAPLYKLVSAE